MATREELKESALTSGFCIEVLNELVLRGLVYCYAGVGVDPNDLEQVESLVWSGDHLKYIYTKQGTMFGKWCDPGILKILSAADVLRLRNEKRIELKKQAYENFLSDPENYSFGPLKKIDHAKASGNYEVYLQWLETDPNIDQINWCLKRDLTDGCIYSDEVELLRERIDFIQQFGHSDYCYFNGAL